MKKTLFTILFCGSIMFASANDVYVSATGNDSNDGLSAASAFATFGKALTAVEDGGIVHVSGFLYACDDDANPLPAGDDYKSGYVIAKNVTVQGGNKTTDGFIGFNETLYTGGRFFTVNNNGTLTLKNLTLKDGIATNKGGAVHVNGGALIAENVIFEACAAEGNNQPSGGAIHVDKATGISFKNCLFKANKAEKGGAFYIQDTQNPSVELRFEACAFTANQATGRGGGALFFRLVDGTGNTINVINSTFSGNISNGNGGTISIYNTPASTTFNLVNSTIVNNIGRSGGGSGGGILVGENDKGIMFRIQNSIIEGNTVSDGVTSEDLTYFTSYEPSSTTLDINNSFIGNVFVSGARTIAPECYAGTMYFNYMPRTYDELTILSGVDAFNSVYNVHPLTAGATALNYGNATFLQNIGISTDQLGTTRTFAGGKCSVGAIEGVGLPTEIRTPELSGKINLRQSDGNLHVAGQGAMTLELISISGQIVTQKSGAGEINLPVGQPKGVYVAKISVAGEVYTQKVIIK
jgi:hypothetical protein